MTSHFARRLIALILNIYRYPLYGTTGYVRYESKSQHLDPGAVILRHVAQSVVVRLGIVYDGVQRETAVIAHEPLVATTSA